MRDRPGLTTSFRRSLDASGALSGLALAALATLPGAPSLASAQRPTSIRDRATLEQSKPPASRSVIDGVVSDTLLRPLASADVSIIGTSSRVVTGENGRFRMLEVPPGQYVLVVRRIGYAPTSGVLQVASGDTLRVSYTLARSLQTLDTVRTRETRISVRMLEFEQRRRAGVGQFITQEYLERRGSMAATDFLRNVRGLEVSRITNDQFAGSVALSRREGGSFNGDGASGACPMQVLLDGIVMPRSFNLDLLPPPKQLAGIEVYEGPATIPPQFGGADRRCGLIAVWTRAGY